MTDPVSHECLDCGHRVANVEGYRSHHCDLAEVRRRARAPLIDAMAQIVQVCESAIAANREIDPQVLRVLVNTSITIGRGALGSDL